MADGSRTGVEGEERGESRSSKEQNVRRRMMTKSSMVRMDDEGEEGDEFRSSTVPKTWRHKHHWKSAKTDERKVAVTTQESSDGIREKDEIGEVGRLVKKNELGDPKVGNIGVGKLMRMIEMGGPQARKLIKKVETGGTNVVELVKKIQMNGPTVGKS